VFCEFVRWRAYHARQFKMDKVHNRARGQSSLEAHSRKKRPRDPQIAQPRWPIAPGLLLRPQFIAAAPLGDLFVGTLTLRVSDRKDNN
jgi:hypothetical protein